MAVLSVNMVTATVLLSVFFLSGALAACFVKSGLFITAPQEMEALTGSCLQIPCNFKAEIKHNLDNRIKIIGVWIKNDPRFGINPDNVIFNSSRTDNKYPMNITGNLKQKNCTTLFSSLITQYTEKYFFRIETKGFKSTAVCDPLHITVKDSPPSPRIQIPGDLKEAESVNITCSAPTPCPHSPPKLTWNLQQDPHNKIEENTDGTFTTKIQETITLTDRHDGSSITCSARYPVDEGRDAKTAEDTLTLSVSYAPKDTSASISPSDLVSAGSWVKLTCSSRAKPPVRFTWFNKTTDGAMILSEGDFYSFRATDEGVYYCVATNDVGNQMSSEIHLSVQGDQQLVGVHIIVKTLGVVMLVGVLVVFECWFRSRSFTKPVESQTGEEPTVRELRPEPSSDSLQDSGQQQDKVSETTNSSTQTADGPEDLYARVKKK